MFRKTIIAIGAAGLIVTLIPWTEAVARGSRGSHGSTSWHSASSRGAGRNDNVARGADPHRAMSHRGGPHNSSNHEGHWQKSSSFGDNRHKSPGHQGEWHESPGFGSHGNVQSGEQGDWHETSSGFEREWKADGDSK
jgi:hypothetical protein